MTQYERDELVNAFYELRNGPDLVADLAQFHSDFFNFDSASDPTQLDIHFNLPDEPERQIFFAWHRYQMFEMEQAMQELNPDISIPWWDSSEDQSIFSPVWDEDFMGSFDAAWLLNRTYEDNDINLLPTPQEVSTVQAVQDFLEYANSMERGRVHAGAHRWVGGAMPTTLSPRDPIFYLHHTFIDKLWDDWETANPGGSSHIITSMIRYDGTYVFNGEVLPLVDPDDITDSNVLGVFYAENQLASLSDYTVSNSHHSIENFYYQFIIDVGDNFVVPSNTNCQVTSINEINLLPGFTAQSGSSFVARIDTGNQASRLDNTSLLASRINNPNPFEYDPAILDKNAYNPTDPNFEAAISVSPNPFDTFLDLKIEESNRQGMDEVVIYDISGRIVLQKYFDETNQYQLEDLNYLLGGVYIIEILNGNRLVLRKKIVKE
ncbi:tyrosinase family protein [Mangrovimonas sp. YM274]|uniref:tyrosinase family protein n=1 Tax=Mangrovimonas sp. YM274 TaxID=3070660 RepID=UPI0027DC177C|nr:tyrosinase family protein [Mangrovimonas sp. YM274]WMI68289.1 tyrosinase family protein [Mangrovimonas sp. YM274]